ncbi:MAG: phosphoribosylanthranilate isomerase [Syntrophobacterales bacterium]|nr:phosphoribosylanthranilate isomerase [Syntrophobacterales bacterium]
MRSVQVKICGITKPEDACFCKERGIDAIGCVFFPKSPRFVDEVQALEIRSAFGYGVVGVFVNPKPNDIIRVIKKTGITIVQLHGEEPEGLVSELESSGIQVIKALFYWREPKFLEAPRFNASAFLAEHGAIGSGGTGASWDWSAARKLREYGKPYLIAGGINPQNALRAIEMSQADGIDLSSGVEKAPGVKDKASIEALMEVIQRVKVPWPIRPIFFLDETNS